ncbi:MAG: hydrophobe/amphiphile efflux-1 family RND transporter [Waddliaceae bacterium]|nr:hydrophobe/amphiphile efflux-1 family RND transporter [Waddliaceae bacterium]
MNISKHFITRPRFATVLSLFIFILGFIGLLTLPINQYPEIAPPQVQVSANYPGASARTVADTVGAPLEQAINGVEGMIYMSSQSTDSGDYRLSVTFEAGTDLDIAQVQVQNLISSAVPRLPDDVRRVGVTAQKSSPDMLLVINVFSNNEAYDQVFIANYSLLKIVDELARLDGVGGTPVYGSSEYSMRVWLDPDRLASYQMSISEVTEAIRSQNLEVSSGTINQTPTPDQHAFELSVETQGRLHEPEEFGRIIIKADEEGRLLRLEDVGRIELAARSYTTQGFLGTKAAVAIPVILRPGANALNTADLVLEKMEELSQFFPEGIEYRAVYNPTEYIRESMQEVVVTLFQAMLLVVLVIGLFLQSWRIAIIPVLAIPVSLMGTFFFLYLFGFSLNTLSLFGLVLAIGIVVDDAIVVVESVERKLREGKEIFSAVSETMSEVSVALIATSLVIVAVFLPTMMMEGVSGAFYKQFGITISIATLLSTVVSLTLTPALAWVLMSKKEKEAKKTAFSSFTDLFNRGMDKSSEAYRLFIRKNTQFPSLLIMLYIALTAIGIFLLQSIPGGFIPEQDQGYAIIGIQLPAAASLERTDAVIAECIEKLQGIDDIEESVAFSGFSGVTFTVASNAGAIFSVFKPFEERRGFTQIIDEMRQVLDGIDEAQIIVIPPPAVRGVGSAGGFKMMILDEGGNGPVALEQATWELAAAANTSPETTSAFTFFETNTPKLYLDIDRERARRLAVPLQEVFQALEGYFGSMYINDFNFLGRSFQVLVQADAPYRLTPDDIYRVRVKNEKGSMVPIGSIAHIEYVSAPARVARYNLFPAAALYGDTSYGYSSGQALDRMEELAKQTLPEGFTYSWTELAYQERENQNTGLLAFILAIFFVFLLLAAQYESWSLPVGIILIVPMCILFSAIGLFVASLENTILTQIGLVVLVGLAAKNAILLVEFARQNEEEKGDMYSAIEEAGKTRLRPILMTAFSFILGVIPLLSSSGAGFEMRRSIGVTVFSGMLGVTVFGLIFTPIFYILCRKLALWRKRRN